MRDIQRRQRLDEIRDSFIKMASSGHIRLLGMNIESGEKLFCIESLFEGQRLLVVLRPSTTSDALVKYQDLRLEASK